MADGGQLLSLWSGKQPVNAGIFSSSNEVKPTSAGRYASPVA